MVCCLCLLLWVRFFVSSVSGCGLNVSLMMWVLSGVVIVCVVVISVWCLWCMLLWLFGVMMEVVGFLFILW